MFRMHIILCASGERGLRVELKSKMMLINVVLTSVSICLYCCQLCLVCLACYVQLRTEMKELLEWPDAITNFTIVVKVTDVGIFLDEMFMCAWVFRVQTKLNM